MKGFHWLARLFAPPEAVDRTLGVRVVRERSACRVHAGGQSALFSETDPGRLLRDLQSLVSEAHFQRVATECEGETVLLSEAEHLALRVQVALHWMRYFHSVKAPMKLSRRELEHPQTWAVVVRQAEIKYGAGSAKSICLAAALLGMAPADLLRWRGVAQQRESLM